MDAVTYPNKSVEQFIRTNLIPVKLPHDHKPLAETFKVKWTPVFIVLDADGNEQHRNVGYLPPDQFVPWLLLGLGRAHFNRGEYPQAVSMFEKIVTGHAKADQAPEAAYYLGVARYKISSDSKELKKAYEKLSSQYPHSEWAKKASPYRLLK